MRGQPVAAGRERVEQLDVEQARALPVAFDQGDRREVLVARPTPPVTSRR